MASFARGLRRSSSQKSKPYSLSTDGLPVLITCPSSFHDSNTPQPSDKQCVTVAHWESAAFLRREALVGVLEKTYGATCENIPILSSARSRRNSAGGFTS